MPFRYGPGSAIVARLPLARDRPWTGHLAAVLAIGLSLAIRFLITDFVQSGYPFVTFVPAVVIVAFVFGARAGATAAILGGAAAWLFFMPGANAFAFNLPAAMAISFYTIIVAIQILVIHLMQTANESALRAQRDSDRLLERSTLLFRELQHRISNNLQVIAALLAAQKRRVSDPAARLALDEAANRLTIVGRISRELYRPDGGRADMCDFFAKLADAVLEASGRQDVRCHLNICDSITLESDQAVPLALIFTEALSNAIEHGLPSCGGEVNVSLHRLPDGRIEMTIIDDGRGLPANFDLARTDSLGLRIAQQLSRQLGGEFELAGRDDAAPGTQARLLIAA